MRIKSAYTEGYLGILEGTGRNELEINFEPAHEAGFKRVLLFGRNGSGKSTFINALTPFPSQGDDRSSIIVPGRAGRKVITFQRGDREIKCDIRWSAKGKASCFMFLDGDDQPLPLTAKGNIGEYLKAVEQELGVTPDFLKIGRVGSRVAGFLDLGPGPRKSYIGNFMPEVEEWAAMHKNVAKRVSAMKSQLQGLQVELERIEARDELENSARRAESDLSRLRDELRRIDTRLGAATGALNEMGPARGGIIQRAGIADADDFNPIALAISAAERDAERAAAQIRRLIEERPKLQNFVDPKAAQEKAAEIRTAIARTSGELDALRSTRADARGRLDAAIKTESEAKASLARASGSAESLATLTARATDLEAKVTTLTEAVQTLPPTPDDMKYEDVKMASDAVMALAAEISDLRNGFPSVEALNLARQHDMDDGSIRSIAVGTQATAKELRQRLDVAKSRITTIEAQASFHSRFAGMHCSDSKCPFERHIGQFASAAQELADKKAEVEALEGRVAASEQEARDLNAAAAAARAVVAAHARLRRHRPVLEVAGVWPAIGPTAAFFDLIAAPSTEVANSINIERLLTSVATRRDLSETERTLAGVRERIAGLEDLRAAKTQLEEAVARASEAVGITREDLAKIDTKVTSQTQVVTTQEQALALLEQLLGCHAASDAAKARVSELSSASAELEAMRARWEEAERDAAQASADRDSVTLSIQQADQALAEARLRLARRDEYESRLAEMQGKLDRAQAVAEACHPARGAPIEFLRDFLDSTRDSVNELLDVAMRGEFRIGFSLSDSEFRIPVAKGSGRVIPDVTEASEGQLALAKTVISLALVKQTVQAQGGYNIICFDEIDGMLDRERNRERFAEIVERLSSELGLEQLVMISHNDNFAASPAGIVLFPGHAMPVTDQAFLSNKLILADFS